MDVCSRSVVKRVWSRVRVLKNSVDQCLVTSRDHRQQVGVENGLNGFSRLPCVNKVDITDNKVVEGVDIWNIQLIGMLHHCQKAKFLETQLDSAEIFHY